MAHFMPKDRYQRLREKAQKLCETSVLLRAKSVEIKTAKLNPSKKSRGSVRPYASSHLPEFERE